MNDSSQDIIDFTVVYNNYKKGLYNYVLKMLNEKFIAEDITHNVFLKFYENIRRIRKTQSHSSWLFTTARNEVYAYLRRKKIKKENRMDDDDDFKSNENLVEELEDFELRKQINAELNLLDDNLREVFLLREYSELSYKEISEILDIEESQVKGRLFRVRQKLIEKIAKVI